MESSFKIDITLLPLWVKTEMDVILLIWVSIVHESVFYMWLD